MSDKVLLILVDGMRPDALPLCGDPDLLEYYKSGTYCLKADTVYPSITLPCHMSLFHSVDPDRHGVLTNTYVPQNHPIDGIVEVLASYRKKSAMFYTFEPLRDLSRPGMLSMSWYRAWEHNKWQHLDKTVTKACIEYINEQAPDFVFLYLGETDESGHKFGWMSEEYLASVKEAAECIKEITAMLPEEYSVIVTADHGGHARNHGEDIAEDMTIPVCFRGKHFDSGKELEKLSIKDIAPTITAIMGFEPGDDWEGTSII
ncbi:MAG: alkaline phosphatase family protein [Clostridia bacterium]|nr:alkaline phosphatase family protein [Clostridia bacterium]